jgi:hypothetical protein
VPLSQVVVVGVGVGIYTLTTVDLGAKWRHFKAGIRETTGSHFSLGLGSNRYDFWRVAVRQFRDTRWRG